MITTTGLTKRFGKNEVLTNIDLHVDAKDIVVLLGPSGSGKSTLLRCLNGLEELSGGKIEVNGVVVDSSDSQRIQRARVLEIRRQTGMVFQQFNLYPHKTVLGNVMEGLVTVKKIKRDEAAERGRILLDRVGLSDKQDAYPSRLSGGQQQRVAIARALAMEPEVMLFDEPTSALDPELVGEVLSVMKELAQEGMTMLVVTHELKFARNVANKIVFMADGSIVEEASPQAFFEHPTQERTRRFLQQITEF
ncbi:MULTISPECIES: amino acid ABC transporter ATP-binding protein [unclassified Paenibacillus]|uniref:amino acid ABC transporter ATP-binding protein n=1 Tax=unclassified Paenibacillus TaxID=185978 RepID=UPI0007BEE9AA|nr:MULTISPECIES: amino acid ABC transporter ATP-binding protein [unclassified Paenibacillus]OAX51054.1 L-cystine import ATP-binding protein TcyC [Paenibacillus sp. AD87]SDM09053.1 amino acid ABC transporter ATP-binding protein, PAAT family [Paenibacillus sp. OK060]SLK18327.1 amino acid ABC transporter ATP-binding protein, PAAT family [Paenibacillus sp. RU5A]SOC75169.1 amino acid ABC transporter ATP-binding protein, PAAT family [Paenibacillus sp. RU26A]SOC77237.1 amino acid ABC transporter ATP-